MADLTNAQIAAAFDELGDLYELDGAVVLPRDRLPHRGQGRARAVRVGRRSWRATGRVTELPGIGKTLEEKLHALDETGDIPTAEEAARQVPERADLGHAPAGLRAQARAAALRRARHRLARGAARGRRGSRRSASCAASARRSRRSCSRRWPSSTRGRARRRGSCSRARRPSPSRSSARCARTRRAERVEVAGSLRRQADSVKDLDIIATAKDPAALAAALGELALVESVLHAAGDAGARVMTHAGMKVDLKVVEPDQFGNVLQHFTGSKAHNVALREAAVRRGLHVSEYGILDDATGETLRCATEEEVYERARARVDPAGAARGPRRARGGAAAAARAAGADHARGHARRPALPHDALRRPPDARADGDGARAARARVPRDHRPLGLARVRRRRHARGAGGADRARSTRSTRALDGFELLAGTEVNILPDGSLDYDDELLARLDWVIASVHTSFAMERAGDDRPHGRRDRAPAGRRDRPPDGPQDRDAPALRARHRARDRGGRAHGHDARDQRGARPPRPQRAPRARGGRGRRADRADQHRRALGAQLRAAAATASPPPGARG